MPDEIYDSVLTALISYSSEYARTSGEIRDKAIGLTSKYTEIENVDLFVDSLVLRLQELEIINDYLYVEKYVKQQKNTSNPKSPIEISVFLRKKKASKDAIDSISNYYDEKYQEEIINTLISKKNYNSKKMFGYLVRRGFDTYLVRKCLF